MLTHTLPSRPALIIRAGCSATVRFDSGGGRQRVLLTFGSGLPATSPDGLDAKATLRQAGTSRQVLARTVVSFDPQNPWFESTVEVDLVPGNAELTIECGPGPAGDPSSDWLAVYEAVVAPPPMFNLQRARAFHDFRTRNELAVCNHTYSQPLYTAAPTAKRMAADANLLATIILDDLIGAPVPEFAALLHRKLARKAPLRILSLASGAARIERQTCRRVRPDLLDITLTDLNPSLLEQASKAMAPHSVKTVVSDLNKAEFPAGPYDVIVCVSALHHIVELERVYDAIRSALAEDGEYWNIGEYVGRTGARLWPDAYAEANAFFRALPEKYRFNHAYHKRDDELPNYDCSITSFESIRSEEVVPVLLEHFTAEWMDIRSTVTWRLFDAAYSQNYDVADAADYELVERGALLDYDLFRRGVKPVSMNGVFLPKR